MTKTRIGGPVSPTPAERTRWKVTDPRTRFFTTVTERASFRTCRRRWYLENVERLQPKGSVTWYLIFGDCIHAAMDAYYRPKRGQTTPPRDLKRAIKAFNVEWEKKDAWLREAYSGFYAMGISEEWEMHKERGIGMLTEYDIFDKIDPFFNEVLAVGVEERSWVDILAPGRERITPAPLLSCRIDLAVRRKDGIWIWDHKALASAPYDRGLDVDDQLTGNCYIWWRLTGEVPRGAVYNVLIKDPPKPPRILNDGSLSKDKSQRTTFEHYMKSIHDLGLSVIDYEPILDYLKEKGWHQFFRRQIVQRNIDELMSFEERVFNEYEDMVVALESEQKRYPNPGQYTCPGCQMIAICQAMEEKGNVDYVRGNGYEAQEPRVVVPEEILSSGWEGV